MLVVGAVIKLDAVLIADGIKGLLGICPLLLETVTYWLVIVLLV